MSILTRKYPFQPASSWALESLRNCAIVFLILYFLQPFGFSAYPGSKLLASFLFGAVTFLCCLIFRFLVFIPLQKIVRPWRIWHEALTVLAMVVFIGLCNFFLAVALFRFPVEWGLCLKFVYWSLVVGAIVAGVSTAVSYHQYLRGQLDALLDKTTEAQVGVSVTLHDTRVRGNDLTLPINDLLYIEAQKNNVAVCYVKDGEVERAEMLTTLAAVLADLADYPNIFQCHRSFAVNVNNITAARGNSNGYTLELGGGLAAVPVSRSFVPKLKSFVA